MYSYIIMRITVLLIYYYRKRDLLPKGMGNEGGNDGRLYGGDSCMGYWRINRISPGKVESHEWIDPKSE